MGATDRGKAKWWLRFGAWLVDQDPNEDGEVKGFCPFHDDQNPSAFWNVQKEVMYCNPCGKGWQFYKIEQAIESGEVQKPNEIDRERIREDLRKKVKRYTSTKTLTKGMVEAYHDALLSNSSKFLWLVSDRGIFDDTIYDHLIGWEADSKRYTIPIFDEAGEVVNIRRYRPDAPPDKKMWNMPGHGSPARLYPIENLYENKDILLVEGEWDALVATQYGVPAVSGTGGAQQWLDEWNILFAGKNVCIIYDNDEAGDKGARRVASALADYAESVSIQKVPLDKKGADVSDLFNIVGWTSTGLKDLIANAKPYTPKGGSIILQEEEEESVPTLNVSDSFDAEYFSKVVDVKCMTNGRVDPPMFLPAKVEFTCNQDFGKGCAMCPMATKYNGTNVMDIVPSDAKVFEILLDNRIAKDKRLKEIRGIHGKCTVVDVDVLEQKVVERLIVQEDPVGIDINADGAGGTPHEREIYNIGAFRTREGTSLRVRGTSVAHPRTNAAVMFAWDAHPEGLDMEDYVFDEHTLALLRRFQPEEGQRPIEKMEEIADNLSMNVTNIYGRTDLHVAIDLVFHSITSFRYRGQYLNKGWLDVMVLGDTRTGKSRAAEHLLRHYNAGKRVSCETASVAGLIGAAQNIEKSWSVRWGAIPMFDRRMIVLDEASGLVKGQGNRRVNLFSELTSIRESGEAQITKAGSSTARARTRLLWLSNPDGGGSIRSRRFGVEELRTLIERREDISRFDFVLGVSSDEVPEDAIHQLPPKQDLVYTSQACNALVMWAWSRKRDQVVWLPEAEKAALEGGSQMSKRYSEAIPLVQVANVNEKIARVAVAIAARTFSTDETCNHVIVKKEHVEDAVDFLDDIYRKNNFGYFQYSKNLLRKKKNAQRSAPRIRAVLRDNQALLEFFASNSEFFSRDLQHHTSSGFVQAGSEFVNVIKLFYETGYIDKVEGRAEVYSVTEELSALIREG